MKFEVKAIFDNGEYVKPIIKDGSPVFEVSEPHIRDQVISVSVALDNGDSEGIASIRLKSGIVRFVNSKYLIANPWLKDEVDGFIDEYVREKAEEHPYLCLSEELRCRVTELIDLNEKVSQLTKELEAAFLDEMDLDVGNFMCSPLEGLSKQNLLVAKVTTDKRGKRFLTAVKDSDYIIPAEEAVDGVFYHQEAGMCEDDWHGCMYYRMKPPVESPDEEAQYLRLWFDC